MIAVAETGAELPGVCRGTGCPAPGASLHLSVTVADEGIFVSAEGGQLAPGCEATGAGPAVRGRDFAALEACLARVHARFPEETSLTLAADPRVPYAALVRAMDAARGADPEAPMFPEIRLSAGVR